MKRIYIFLFFIFPLLLACTNFSDQPAKDASNNTASDSSSYVLGNETKKLFSSTYCAEVKYHNPNTGTNSTYHLIVVVKDNELKRINFPSGGWMDNDHFDNVFMKPDGTTAFSSYERKEYQIKIIGDSAICFSKAIPPSRPCDAFTKKGKPCKNKTSDGSGKCHAHKKV